MLTRKHKRERKKTKILRKTNKYIDGSRKNNKKNKEIKCLQKDMKEKARKTNA